MPTQTTFPSIHLGVRNSASTRFSFGVVAFLASFAARWILTPVLGTAVPYMFFFPGIVVSAWYGGLGSGLVTTGLSALASIYFLNRVNGGFSTAAGLAWIIFVCIGAFLSWLNHAFRRSQRRALDELEARREYQAALRTSEERFTLALQAGGGIGAWDWDIASDRVFCNPELAELYSVDPQAATTGIPLSEFIANIHPDDASSVASDIQNAVATGGDFAREYRMLQHGNSPRWIYARGHCHLDPQDRPARFPGVAFDITERKQAEQALRDSQERLRAIYDGTYEHIGLLSPDGILLEANRASLDFAGKTRAEVVGRPFWETPWFTTTPHGAETIRDAVARAATGQFVRYESLLCHTSGECPVFDISLHPVRNENGEVILIVPEGRDITDLKRAEQDLKRSNEELKRLNRELEEFAYVASHDLQEPLRMVNVYTQLLLRRVGNEDASVNEYAAFIRGGVTRMEALIRDLLSFSQIVHEQKLTIGAASLSTAFREAVSVLQRQIEESGAVINAPYLPTVRGDTPQMTHVFQNLLSNALKYRKPDVPPEIHIAAQLNDGHWTISVRDNGIGFEQQYASQIFGLFKRLHKNEYPGTGLGLAICERIIERYGGRIWAEGHPGAGATFSFSLPSA